MRSGQQIFINRNSELTAAAYRHPRSSDMGWMEWWSIVTGKGGNLVSPVLEILFHASNPALLIALLCSNTYAGYG